jgi:hypothetical protein
VKWPPDWKLVVRDSPASKDVNMGADEATSLETDTSQRLVKTQWTKRISIVL